MEAMVRDVRRDLAMPDLLVIQVCLSTLSSIPCSTSINLLW
jgi:hypothetical protein